MDTPSISQLTWCPPPHMQLIVRVVSPRHIIGDHRQAVRLTRSRRLGNLARRVTSVVGVTDSSCAGGASDIHGYRLRLPWPPFSSMCRNRRRSRKAPSVFSFLPPRNRPVDRDAVFAKSARNPNGIHPQALVPRGLRELRMLRLSTPLSASAIGRCCASCTIPPAQ